MGQGIRLTEIVEKMDLKNLTPEVEMTEKEVHVPDVNRPSLQLAGFFDHFDSSRVQIIGNVEHTYVQTLSEKRREEIFDKLLQHPIPCVVFCRNMDPVDGFLEKAVKYGVPVFKTAKQTSDFTAEIIRWMNVKLAPCISIHGVLVDVYGVGVLIMGESGIGKSEAALELIKRGHRLVTDDVVEIRKVSDMTAVLCANDISAVGALRALREHRVSDRRKISVIAIDNAVYAFSQILFCIIYGNDYAELHVC